MFDCYFEIGSTHAICQDYVLVDNKRKAAFLSDGCSSSPSTDFGSRFLTLAAQRCFSTIDPWAPTPLSEDWVSNVIFYAYRMIESSDLPVDCLDATLGTIFVRDGQCHVVLCGDGVIAARQRNGIIDYYIVECPCGAPDYPSYLLDTDRRIKYLDETGGMKTVSTFANDKLLKSVKQPCFDSVRLEFDPSQYDLVAVLSDGVRSFQKTPGVMPEPVSEYEVLRQVMAVQCTTGSFVVRRVRNGFINRYCLAEKWKHYDDFAMAAVAMDQP